MSWRLRIPQKCAYRLPRKGPDGGSVLRSVKRAGGATHRALVVVRNGLENLFSLILVPLDDEGRRASICDGGLCW